MRKLFIALFVLALALGSTAVFAQASGKPPRVLTQATVDKFIADIPALSKEFDALAAETETQAGNASQGSSSSNSASIGDLMDVLRTNAKANAILRRHGWDSSFWKVYGAIASGYFLTMMDEAYAQSKEPTMKQYADQYRAAVNPADAALVAKNRDRLQQVFGDAGGE